MTNNHENRKWFFQDRIKDYHGEKNTATCQYSWVDGRLVHIDSLTDHKAVGHCILDNSAYPWVAVNSLGHYASGRSVEFADMRIAKQEWDIPKQQTYKEFLAAHDRDTLYEADDWLAWMRHYAVSYYETYEKSQNAEKREKSHSAITTEATAEAISELLGLTIPALLKKAADYGIEIDQKAQKKAIAQEIIVALLDKA